jgi:hypothetical protein
LYLNATPAPSQASRRLLEMATRWGYSATDSQHGLRAAEGAFAVDHPFDPARWRQIFREGIAVREVGVRTKELQEPGGMGGDELF